MALPVSQAWGSRTASQGPASLRTVTGDERVDPSLEKGLCLLLGERVGCQHRSAEAGAVPRAKSKALHPLGTVLPQLETQSPSRARAKGWTLERSPS